MNPQLSVTRSHRIRNLPLPFGGRSIRNYPQPSPVQSATGTSLRRIEVKGRKRDQPIRLTTNEWYKSIQLGDSYWLYVVWDPLGKPDATPLRIQNPAKHLDHAKKEVVAARFFDIPAAAIEQAAARLSTGL